VKDRALLALYLGLVVAGSLVHDARWLGAGLALVILSAWRDAWPLMRRTVRAVWPFVTAIALGWLLVQRGDWRAAAPVTLRITARVTLLTMLAFRMLPAVSLPRALGFSPTLRFVLVLATSQLLTFRRLFTDFRLALLARTPRRVGPTVALRHGATTAAWFLRRAEHDATLMSEALDARGFFLDRD
jgi:hypothetical protein